MAIENNNIGGLDVRKIERHGPIQNDALPLSDRAFITKEKSEQIAKVFKKMLFESNVVKHWGLDKYRNASKR